MKGMTLNKTLLWTLLPIALAAVVSCTKTGGPSGDTVRFSVGLASDETRTAYSGEGTVVDGLLKKERIDWLVNDQITVYSPEAMKMDWSHSADYKVNAVSTHDDSGVTPSGNNLMSHATVTATAGTGLTWEAGTNHFYGMYPSAVKFTSTDAGYGWIALDQTVMKGTIPATQSPTWTGLTGEGDVTGAPDMRYAFMYASQTAVKGSSEVNLVFKPKFTAFEFTIGSGENDYVHLSTFKLETTASGAFIAGNFSYDGATESMTVSNTGASSSIEVTFPTGTVVTRETPTASGTVPAKNLTFTILALPVDITSLKITFTGTEIETRSLALNDGNGVPLNFTACKKYRIRGLSFPSFLLAEGNDIDWDLEAHGEALNWY